VQAPQEPRSELIMEALWVIKAPRLCPWRLPRLRHYDATRYNKFPS
jgi:hypothetical protein